MDDEYLEVFEDIEDQIAPPLKLTPWLLLGDLFANVGTVIESIATIPNDTSLRIQGHQKWLNSRALDREEAARTIEQIEAYVNEDRSGETR